MSSKKVVAGVFVVSFCVLLLGAPVFPQAYSGQISGIVTDQSGGAIVGATVTVTDVDRGVSRTLTTGSAGEYNATSLTPGNYAVKAEFKGFKTVEQSKVVLEVGNPQFNGAGGNLPFSKTSGLGASTQTPAVSNNNPSIGSGADRSVQMGFRLSF